ncbi:hypothetical protein R6Q57_006846 [Mikania cordata]
MRSFFVFQLKRSYITDMDADMAHDDVGQQGPPMDPDTLALSQHEWLQFEAGSATTMRLITVEFLSTFRYRAHQAAVRVDEDAELPPDIEFSLCGQHFEMGRRGDEGLVGPGLRYAVHRPPGPGDDDQGSSDQIHPPVHRDDHLRSRPVAGVGDYDRSILSALTPRKQAVQPVTVFRLVLRLLLPPSGAWYTVEWRLHHPHCPDQRHG